MAITKNNLWEAFDSLSPLINYPKEKIELFAVDLFTELDNDEEAILEAISFMGKVAFLCESFEKSTKEIAIAILQNYPKGVEKNGFTLRHKTLSKFDYSGVFEWSKANNSVSIAKDYQKQIEEIAKTGGTINGQIIERVTPTLSEIYEKRWKIN